MSYNLGANPQYNTPKLQMGYLANVLYPKGNGGASELKLDATVFGGLYQLGRKDLTHDVSTYRDGWLRNCAGLSTNILCHTGRNVGFCGVINVKAFIRGNVG
jgi:hypothetical protein